MFYQIEIEITGLTSYFEKNMTRESALTEFVCPFLAREITLFYGQMYNMGHIGGLKVFETDKPIDSDWPVKSSDIDISDKMLFEMRYDRELRKAINDIARDVTSQMYQEATLLIETGGYKELQKRLLETIGDKYAFFICPFGNAEVDHNYEFVIKPTVQQYQFTIQRADEISHTREITEIILSSIARSKFVIADLTDVRPNCYYEVGYAHALRKPFIILAKANTQRHFDISTYKWNYWNSYVDLKPTLEREIASIMNNMSPKS